MRRWKARKEGSCRKKGAKAQEAASATENIWFAPGVASLSASLDDGLHEYIRPLYGTESVPGHDGFRAPWSS
jgi:hypothetical protein